MQRGQHQVTGQRRLDGDLGGLQVANFPEHDDIGILTQEGAEGLAEGHAGRFIDLHLHDPLDVELHRVFDREELGVDLVDMPQAGIKGRGFAAARGPGDREDAVGLVDGLDDEVVTIFGQTQRLEVQLHGPSIQNAEHYRLTEGGRQRGETKIDLFTRNHRANAPVLREPSLGDVQVGHDLQTRGHGRGQMLRWWRHFVEGPIDAVADLELVFEGFEVDVRGPILHSLHQDQVDELHYGDVVDRVVQGNRQTLGAFLLLGRLDVHPQFLEQGSITKISLCRIKLLNAGRYLDRIGHDHLQGVLQGEAQLIHRLGIERVGQGNLQGVPVKGHRDHLIHPSRLVGHRRDGFRRNGVRLQGDHHGPQMIGHDLEDGIEVEQPVILKDLDHRLAAALHLLTDLLDLKGVQEPALSDERDEWMGDCFGHGG